jgi:hypothetical protein
MAANGNLSMISPPSSTSNGLEPQLPPLLPPLRSTQILQPFTVYHPGLIIEFCNIGYEFFYVNTTFLKQNI